MRWYLFRDLRDRISLREVRVILEKVEVLDGLFFFPKGADVVEFVDDGSRLIVHSGRVIPVDDGEEMFERLQFRDGGRTPKTIRLRNVRTGVILRVKPESLRKDSPGLRWYYVRNASTGTWR